jgi:predicted dienelactone hydrolase
VPARLPFLALVWYPTQADEVPWQERLFTIAATRDAPVADGRFPVVLLSHGGGATGGSPLILAGLATSLARRGMIVIAPMHAMAGLSQRRLQVVLALDAVTNRPPLAAHADATRLGMIGFSLGGAVTLMSAGAVFNEGRLAAYCAAHPSDVMDCGAPPGGASPAPPKPLAPPPAPLGLKAVVLLDPYAMPFGHDDLAAVTAPVLLFRPERSALSGEVNALALPAALPSPPELHTVPGGHFVFADACTAVQWAALAEICDDPPGVDRKAVQAEIETEIAKFLDNHM